MIHRIAKCLDIPVIKGYAVENQKYKIVKYKHKTNVPESEYQLKIYERVLQLGDVTDSKLAIFVDAALTACPPGVKLNVHEHTPELEEIRYVPEYEVINLEKEKLALDEKLKEQLK